MTTVFSICFKNIGFIEIIDILEVYKVYNFKLYIKLCSHCSQNSIYA